MAANSRIFRIILCAILISLLRLHVLANAAPNDTSVALCNMDLSQILPPPYSNVSDMVCKPLWRSYLLQYSQTDDNVVTIVLSTVYSTGWVGIGFSKDGMMLHASCIVGWVYPGGQSTIKQYYAEDYERTKVIPDRGELPLTQVSPSVVLHDSTLYLAFQLKYSTPLKDQLIILASGSAYPEDQLLTSHDDKINIKFDFSKGNLTPLSAPDKLRSLRHAHGILAVLGWGLTIPYGAMLARFLRHQRRLWFILHVTIQFMGFLFGLATVALGLTLERRMHAEMSPHKDFGLFVLVLSILQVMAICIRPQKDSKERKPWNWYHHWVGRISIFAAAVNTIVGLHMASAGNAWKICYGLLLCTNFIVWIVLEVMSKRRQIQEPAQPPPVFHTNQS